MFGSKIRPWHKFDLPKGWLEPMVFNFIGPNEDGVEHNLLLTLDRSKRHDNIKDFAKERTQPILSGLKGAEVLKDEDITVDDGHPAWEFVYKWMPSDDKVTINKYVFVLIDGVGFTFSMQFNKKSYQTVGLQLKNVIESIAPGTYRPVEE